MATAAKPKPKKSVVAPKKSKSSPSHPPFVEMITDAIVVLKERTGSSQYAITKFIEEKHKQLPPNFRKLLLYHLKKSVGAGKLVKIKYSFKLPPTRSAPAVKPKDAKPAKAMPKPNARSASKPKPKTAAKPKAADRPKAIAKAKTAAATAKAAKPKAKPAGKVARTLTKASPGKKVTKPAKKAAVKTVRKPRSAKSPAKKAKK